jgi:beta-phosphoglucomutase-like phosphatase (HAD superfamily)
VIKALLFDFDGVISASIDQHLRAWQVVLPPIGVEPDPLVLRRHEGEPAWRIAQEMCLFCGKSIDEPEARRLAALKNDHFRSQPGPGLYAGVTEILDYAVQAGLKTAVVTGTTHQNIQYVLGEWIGRFDALFGDGDYARPKPNPDPYLAAVDHFALPPEACVVIENAPMGIRAAKSAGLFCLALLTTLPREELSQADLVLPDHASLLQWLREGQKSLD